MRLSVRAYQCVLLDRGRENVIDLVEGIARLEGVLEDGLHLKPELAALFLVHLPQGLALVEDRTVSRSEQPHHQVGEGGFAAATFTDYGGNGGRRIGDGQGDVVQRRPWSRLRIVPRVHTMLRSRASSSVSSRQGCGFWRVKVSLSSVSHSGD